jgi:tetratricopeptide (TPR) repeat protein
MMNIGMNAMHRKRAAAALESFQEAMRLNREVGDLWEVALAHHNLANAARMLGDFPEARSQYAAGIRIYRDYRDRWALALLLEDVAVLAALTASPAAALELIGGVESLREEIGSPRAPSLQAELDEQLAPARAELAETGTAAALARGRGHPFDYSVTLALEVCAVS